MSKPRLLTLSFLILGAALSRLIPHPWNFSPLGAIALFGGAYFIDKRWAFGMPLLAAFLSDIFLGFYSHFLLVYVGYLMVAGVGMLVVREKTVLRILGGSLLGSVVFFLWTNFISWMADPIYMKDLGGLMASYTAGIPFFQQTLSGDLLFAGILFGSFALAEKFIPKVSEAKI